MKTKSYATHTVHLIYAVILWVCLLSEGHMPDVVTQNKILLSNTLDALGYAV
jgi:hypothetical protein